MIRRGRIFLADTPERFLESEHWYVRAFIDGEVPEEDHP
jgi:ABC-type transporter Mla maintaining outer membrane lipid asymmetry ATPase subunit MlaF